MATIYKCDKCGKIIKGEEISLNFSDMEKKFFERSFNHYNFCEICIKPLVIYLKGFLKVNNKVKK